MNLDAAKLIALLAKHAANPALAEILTEALHDAGCSESTLKRTVALLKASLA